MAWHMGHPLSQTLFTSIHLDKLLWPVPKSFDEYNFHRGDAEARLEHERKSPLVHLVFRAYCLGLVKACDLVNNRITHEYFYEVGLNVFVSTRNGVSDAAQEEDFVPQLYNRSLLSEHDIGPVKKTLETAVEYLEKHGNGIDENVKRALIDRLRLRSHFLDALSKDVDAVISRDRASFISCLALVAPIESSVAYGTPNEDAFTLKIQRKLASTIPPRPMVTISAKTALDFLKRLFQDAIDMHEILDYTSPNDLRVRVFLSCLVWGLSNAARFAFGRLRQGNHNQGFISDVSCKHSLSMR
jgi:N-alpha-acetyltransferase 35, NatC auxiliary subunit